MTTVNVVFALALGCTPVRIRGDRSAMAFREPDLEPILHFRGSVCRCSTVLSAAAERSVPQRAEISASWRSAMPGQAQSAVVLLV